MATASGAERHINAGDLEHLGVMAAGTALLTVGLVRRNWLGWGMAILGGAMVARGAQGYKRLYPLVGKEIPGKPITLPPRAIKIEKTLFINRSPDELYEFWRNLENLPKVMSHLLSVQLNSGNRSHWVAKAPAGTVVEWDAEVINDVPNRLIAWQSLEGSDVDNAGSIHFEPYDEGGTQMKVVIRYTPPGDVLGAKIAKIFGSDPEKQIERDLLQFKRKVETENVQLS